MESPWGAWLVAASLLTLLALGGSNQQSVAPRMISIGIGLTLLGVALYRLDWRQFYAEDRLLSWVLMGVGALFVIQLVPLPPSIWSALPGRDLFVYGDQLMVGVLPNRPVSLDPDATIADAVFLFAPLGVYAFLRATQRDKSIEQFFAIFVVFAGLSLLLALAQAFFGSGFYLYETRSATPTGLFANRNHQAIMFACAIPISAAFIIRHGLGDRFAERAGLPAPTGRWIICIMIFGIFAIGALLTGSRTGSLLLVPAIGAAAVIGNGLPGVSRRALLIVAGILAVGTIALTILPNMGGPLGLVFSRAITGEEDRFSYWPAAFNAAMVYFPVGSGIGTFDQIFQVHEPVGLLAPLHLYNAHNDWLELMLETGLFGPALGIVFLVWLARRMSQVWRRPGIDAVLPRAASVVILLLLLHSVVDYPLRMTALATLFAAAVCVLAGQAQTVSRLRTGELCG